MSALKLDRLGVWVQANGAALDFVLPPEIANPDADSIALAEPCKEVGAAVVEPRNDEYVNRGNSTRQYTICCTKDRQHTKERKACP